MSASLRKGTSLYLGTLIQQWSASRSVIKGRSPAGLGHLFRAGALLTP
ncbi:hypothetical protein SynA1544_01335 [Synechococcus sp. A15-44]|nr:hypothetical protein SynA1544_01335 [Synechococcus sp. A15-44]